jgi:hypothetical protein
MFALHATDSYPTTTQALSVITGLYREAYRIMYPRQPDKYSADDSTDTDSIIDVSATFSIIQTRAETLCDDWFLSGVNSPKPPFVFSEEEENDEVQKLRDIADSKSGDDNYIDNVRLHGSDYADWAGMY